MDLVDKIITFWASVAVLWLVLIGPLCVFFGARIARHKGLSYLRSAAINGMFFVATALVGVVWGVILGTVGIPPVVMLVVELLAAFAAGVLFVKWLARVRITVALKIFGIAFVMMAAIQVAFFSVMSIEEELRPEVVAALQVEPDPDPDSNMFYALMGFSGSPNEDAYRAGREQVEKFNRNLDEQGGGAYAEPFEEPEPVKLARYDELEDLFDAQPGLSDLTPQDSQLVTEIHAANRSIIDAYLELRHYESFHNAVTPHLVAPLPQFITLMRVNRLILAKVRVDFLAGDSDAAIEALRGEIAFSRFLLAEAETLISKMIAVALTKRCLELYAELLDDGALVASDLLLDEELAGMTRAEWGLGQAMRWEFQAAAAVMAEVDEMGFSMATADQPEMPELGFSLLWKENDAINMLHTWYDAMARDFELPAHEYAELEIPEPEIEPGWREAIFNPVAVILMQIAVPAFERYYHRMFEVDGLIRLVRLKQEIRVKQITPVRIPEFLASVGDDLKNPYTLEPMLWDAKQMILSFERVPGEDDCSGEVGIGKLRGLQAVPEPEPESQEDLVESRAGSAQVGHQSNGSTETSTISR